MDRIYDQAKDQNVAALVIYGKETTDNKAYSDSECKVQMTTDELKDAFIKRALIKVGEKYFMPIDYSEVSKAGSVNYVSTTGESSTLKTVLINVAAVARA